MDNAARGGFISFTFVVGFGLGIFLGAMLGLLAVLVALPEDETPALVEVPIFVTGTPNPAGPDAPQVKTTAALAVRVGPGESYATLGTIARGDEVDVVGRDFDSKWLAIRFPRGSSSRGWIPSDNVEGLAESNVRTLAVLLPTPLPFVFTTPSPFFGGGGGGSGGVNNGGPGGPVSTATPIPTTSDLDIASVAVLPDGRVSVTVINRGPKNIANEILIVVVRDLSGSTEQLSHAGSFVNGSSITLRTEGFRVSGSREVQVIVDPSSGIPDHNRGNNVRTITLVAPPVPVPPTATPGPFG
jgi:hypothetical protein